MPPLCVAVEWGVFGMAMTDLEQTAMERLHLASQMSLKLYKQPLLLTDSGGKDSAVICKLAENAGIPFEICHSHTTADARTRQRRYITCENAPKSTKKKASSTR